MICWSCEKNAGDGALCTACGAVQPPDRAADHFQVFGLPRAHDIDLPALERRYKELTKVLHPDRFARADARARRASLARTVQLNDAWRTLRDPVKRAEYLLSLSGIDVGGEEGTSRRAADGAKVKMPVPQALLLEVMELREALHDAHEAGDTAKVGALAANVGGRRDRALASVAGSFRAPAPDLESIAAELVAVRYWDRFLDEVAHQTETTAGAPHAS